MRMANSVQIEERIFELFGNDYITAPEISATIALEFGVSEDEALDAARKVLRERGTPRRVRIRETVDRLADIRL